MANRPQGWVIISGAGGAFGQSLVRHFLDRGRNVLALDSERGRLASLGTHDDLVARPLDLCDESVVEATLDDTVPRSASIDLLVNAVGMIWNEPVVTLSGARLLPHKAETWRRVIDANLTAPFILASRVATRMARRGGGSIINFSSISASGNAGQAAYSAAKAGIGGLTRAMAAELGPLGIRVNAIAPGFVEVESTRAALGVVKLADYEGQTPLRRLGQVEEIIDTVEFLHRNTFVNGIVLNIDGGLRL